MLERREHSDGAVTYHSPLLAEHRVPHAFTTRTGPDGKGFDPTAAGTPPLLCRVAEARAQHVTFGRQVHGSGVWLLDGDRAPREADALVSRQTDTLVAVVTADCVPILMADESGDRVAAVHAGWRGLVAGVLPAALSALDSHRAVAAIGPCLSLERFEVGPEVALQFEQAGLGETVYTNFGPKPHIDLRSAAAIQLERAGVTRIDCSSRCTWDEPELYSYRRDVTHGGAPRTGRLAAVIGVRCRDRG